MAVGTAEQIDNLRIGVDDLSPQQLMEAANNWAKRNNFTPDQLQVCWLPTARSPSSHFLAMMSWVSTISRGVSIDTNLNRNLGI